MFYNISDAVRETHTHIRRSADGRTSLLKGKYRLKLHVAGNGHLALDITQTCGGLYSSKLNCYNQKQLLYLRSSGLSFSVKKVMAFPRCPALPVRPMEQNVKTVDIDEITILLNHLYMAVMLN